ncbi:redox-regulated ATPase YchF [Patescibacteria group bacterium]|nr:redox-regulated ATPase YchF [Patescibacteria group bacterium]MBU1703401.1 redox-regulated ATPase YchF [Patescibacteria group bacterium]MBU1953734.1 redox-regulated ATPase YchF [Patescibacteria group bacterium]
MKIGIVGLPNVGKSTLFNAVTRSRGAKAENFPFCTIDPNIGIVEVPDERIPQLKEVAKTDKVIPAVVEFVDIAGLVKGASIGEGLGNQFLSHIRECDAIAQVIRVFEDSNVTHVHDIVDPKRDIEIIETELILADAQTLEKRLAKAESDAKSGDKEKKDYAQLLRKIQTSLGEGKKILDQNITEEEMSQLKDLHFLTAKPLLYIANVHENEIGLMDEAELRQRLGLGANERIIPISAKIEEELGSLTNEEAQIFLEELGLKETGLNALIKAAYDTLGLQTYFTAGVKEVRAWTIHKGDTAPKAAGVIHTDFEKGFIRAEVVFWRDLVECGSEAKAREKGLVRTEGKDYVVKDGDVMHFLFSS